MSMAGARRRDGAGCATCRTTLASRSRSASSSPAEASTRSSGTPASSASRCSCSRSSRSVIAHTPLCQDVPERFEPAPLQALHGVLAPADRRRDLRDGHLHDDAQNDDLRLGLGQLLQRAAQQVGVQAARRRRFRALRPAWQAAAEGDVLPAACPAEVVGGEVPGDLEQPRLEGALLLPVPGQGAHHADEHVFGEVFGGLRVADPVVQVAEYALAVALVEPARSRPLAGPGTGNSCVFHQMIFTSLAMGRALSTLYNAVEGAEDPFGVTDSLPDHPVDVDASPRTGYDNVLPPRCYSGIVIEQRR